MDNALVSILIITFNSSKYILETLESAKNQLYENIELIISDDCSTDNTVIICKSWLENNAGRFVRTKILTVPQNTGICSNLNRGFKECKGLWIKSIAGDDMLLPNCISDNMEFVESDKRIEITLSEMVHFNDSYQESNIIDRTVYNNRVQSFLQKGCYEQLQIIVKTNYLPAPTIFVKNGLLDKYGLFYEKYFFEDWPMWITLIENNIRIYYLKKTTVAYRHHSNSLTANNKYLFNIHHIDGRMNIMRDMCYKYYSKRYIHLEEFEYRIVHFFNNHKMNVATRVNRILYNSIHKVLSYLKTI